jgi:hypothetical protein
MGRERGEGEGEGAARARAGEWTHAAVRGEVPAREREAASTASYHEPGEHVQHKPRCYRTEGTHPLPLPLLSCHTAATAAATGVGVFGLPSSAEWAYVLCPLYAREAECVLAGGVGVWVSEGEKANAAAEVFGHTVVVEVLIRWIPRSRQIITHTRHIFSLSLLSLCSLFLFVRFSLCYLQVQVLFWNVTSLKFQRNDFKKSPK